MKVCKSCKYAKLEAAYTQTDQYDPRYYKCQHPACVDPVVGFQISCVEARNISVYCGRYGDFYEPKEETEEKDSENTKIIT